MAGIDAVFDARADDYSRSDWHVRYAERLVTLAGLTTGQRVLDAATGTGFAALAAASAVGAGGRVVGVDISEGMLEHARRAARAAGLTGVEFVRADATALDRYPDGSFDVVLCSAGLLYLSVGTALKEWRRLLVHGGLVGFSTMREGGPVPARMFREEARAVGLSLTDPATPLGTAERCDSALTAAGFTDVRVVAEPIRFAPTDLDQAWDAHVRGTHHDAVTSLPPERLSVFRENYVSALDRLRRTEPDQAETAEVLYAFGRR